MFGAHPAKSAATTELIQRAFATGTRGRSRDGSTVVYGYGGAGPRKNNYVLGFNIRDRELIVLPITNGGDPMGDPLIYRVKDGASFHKLANGAVRLESPKAEQDLEITVPPSSPDSNEAQGLRAINQYEDAANFMTFIKSV